MKRPSLSLAELTQLSIDAARSKFNTYKPKEDVISKRHRPVNISGRQWRKMRKQIRREVKAEAA